MAGEECNLKFAYTIRHVPLGNNFRSLCSDAEGLAGSGVNQMWAMASREDFIYIGARDPF
jgi:hypothetical protein